MVKFWSNDAKVDFFKSYIKLKNFCVTSIGFQVPSRVYVNENLTARNFQIFTLAREMKNEGKIYSYSTVKCRVLIKMTEKAKGVCMNSINHLNEIVAAEFIPPNSESAPSHSHSSKMVASKADTRTHQHLSDHTSISTDTDLNSDPLLATESPHNQDMLVSIPVATAQTLDATRNSTPPMNKSSSSLSITATA